MEAGIRGLPLPAGDAKDGQQTTRSEETGMEQFSLSLRQNQCCNSWISSLQLGDSKTLLLKPTSLCSFVMVALGNEHRKPGATDAALFAEGCLLCLRTQGLSRVRLFDPHGP